MSAPLRDESWRVDVISVGRKTPRTLAAKVALMERWDALLGPLPGRVELRAPAHVVTLLEDVREPEPEGGWRGDGDGIATGARVQAPSALFLGRQLSGGAADHLAAFALSERRYLGRTTLPPELAYLMAVQARVVAGSRVVDPFCGTGSVLLSCAALGAATLGVEIDERVLEGEVAEGVAGVAANFEDARLPCPRLLLGDMARFDALVPHDERFDAVVTDPPYGLMEGLGPFYLPLGQRLTALLRLACRRLRRGGRLVFLLPLPAAADAADAVPTDLPTARCLLVERISRQRLSRRMHRLMVTMVKVAEPATRAEGLGGEEDEEAGGGLGGESGSSSEAVAPWEEWWRTVDTMEQETSSEAKRVW